VDVARFERTLERTPGLRARLFVENEQGLAARSLAARFAAKEALAKALGAPPELRWIDAEIRTAEDGCPSLHVAGTVQAVGRRLGVTRWHVSMSHDGGMATAIVIAEGSQMTEPQARGAGWTEEPKE
jgi:holo-[acyl-carrier protein] synthase